VSVPVEIIPLGTASAIPAFGRHLSAFVLQREGQAILFDCGEGAQYRLTDAGVSASRLEAIFITHLHGDHLFGLPGLITTMSMLGRQGPLTVVAPAGIRAMMEILPGMRTDWLTFPLSYVEIEAGTQHAVVYDTPRFRVEARPLEHRVFTVGFRFEEYPRPGKVDARRAHELEVEPLLIGALVRGHPVSNARGELIEPAQVVGPPRPGIVVAYCLDTAPCPGAVDLARDADLLIHEATFTDESIDRAAETAHSTARQAAETARAAGARRLLLSHFSARFDDLTPLVEEARKVFPETEAAVELERVRVESRG